jgi:hypothetical protein
MTDFTTPKGELSLQEMLADPIVQRMMARDGVAKQDLEGLISTVRDRRVRRQMAANRTDHHDSSPITIESARRQ